ncbi:MAG TPA: beta-L-arabinofuranosidase domain-containing protein [Steroidobacteraceae bacterium]
MNTVSAMRRLPLGSILPRGWMRAQMRRDLATGFAGCLDALSPHVARDLFRERLDDATGHAGWWDAESRGNWLWGYTMLAYLSGLEDHRARADALVRELRATQDPDGYIGIHSAAARYPAGDAENGELWAQSRAILVLLAHHELTGAAASLESARRAADLTLTKYGPGRPHFGRCSTLSDRTGQTHGLCFADALEALYEVTSEDRYRDFARWMLDDFDAWPVPFPNDDLAAANLADPGRPLHGHAVHTVEHLRAVAFGGAPEASRLQAALRKLRASATRSGAVIGDESLHGLPGPGAGYEYCTLTELTFSLARLAQHLADPGLADWLERLVFNAAQASRTADGRALAYLCSDTRLDALASRPDSYSLLSGRHGRFKLSPTHDDVACCCNPNATRLLPHYVAALWMRCTDEPALAAFAYGPSELRTVLDGKEVVILQDTAYPFEDEIRFTVTVAAPLRMRVKLRRPGWAAAARVEGATCREEDAWITIDGMWRGSTSFVLRLELPVLAERYPGGEVAVLRGPLQFVQPVPHRSRVLRERPRAQWCDEELLPADPEDIAARLPVLECSQRDLGLAVMRDAGGDPDDPWSDPPLRLAGGGFVLVPIGAAPLRRAAFISRSGT